MPDRSIDTGRQNIGDRGGITPTVTTPREVPTQAMRGTLREVSGRSITDKETTPVTPTTQFESKPFNAADKPDFFGLPTLTQDTGVQNGATQPRSFGSDPLGILADIFSSAYGRAPVESPQAPVVVGDASQGSDRSSNAGLLVLLGIVAVVGYFIYKRMNKQ